MEIKVNFSGFECVVKKAQYGNGRTALRLIDVEDGSPVAVATVNLPDVELEADEVLIKTYSENAGMLETLIDAGVIEDTGKNVQSGYVVLPVCKLLF